MDYQSFDSIKLIETVQSLLNNKGMAAMNQASEDMAKFFATTLKTALDVSIIVAITDKKGDIIYANDKFCKLSKYSYEELIGKNHRILSSGHHEKSFFKEMWKQISQGKVWEGEVKNKAKDGSYYWVKTTIVPVTNHNGKPFMYIALRTDITEGKLAQEKLVSAMKNDFSQIVSSLHNLIFKVAIDEEGNYHYTQNEGNLAYELGLESEKMLHKRPAEVFPPELAKILEQKYASSFLGNTESYTYSFGDKHLLTYLSPVERDGKIIEVIGCVSDITDLHLAQEEIQFLAYHDLLTNLPNRRKFNEDASKIITEAKENNSKFAVLFLDLDRFKQINDSLGHTIGDHLIVEICNRLRGIIDKKGTIYRFAGDEFIIILPDIENMKEVTDYANRVISAFEKVFLLTESVEVYTTASLGISLYPDHGTDYETLLKNADTAMYHSKLNGRNAFHIYRHEMNKHNEESLMIEYHLRKALDHNQDELELFFQPKLELANNQINGVEVLLRWNSSVLGSVSPTKFIPIAEDTGLIIKLDEWVLEKACQQNKLWNESKFSTPVKIAVNISPLHFRLPNFQNVVSRILQKTGLDPSLLEIEITESSFIDNIEECIKCLNDLRELGVTVAIDDFGKGYSSLNYLRRFPINSLKIDREFVQEVSENLDDVAIVKAITYLAHELNLKVVAEGTETKEVIDVLQQLGCDEVQGYYISKPLPSKEFESFFANTAYA